MGGGLLLERGLDLLAEERVLRLLESASKGTQGIPGEPALLEALEAALSLYIDDRREISAVLVFTDTARAIREAGSGGRRTNAA